MKIDRISAGQYLYRHIKRDYNLIWKIREFSKLGRAQGRVARYNADRQSCGCICIAKQRGVVQIFFHVQLAFPGVPIDRRDENRRGSRNTRGRRLKRAFLIIKMPSFPLKRYSFKSLSTILHARYYRWALPCIWRGFLYLSGTTRIRRHEGEQSTGMTPFSL